MPEKVTKPSTVIAIARAWLDFGDDGGCNIRAGGDSIARDTGYGRATVLRVRKWLLQEGFGHMESGAVQNKKAAWWHAAIPGRFCSTCIATTDPSAGSVAEAAIAIPLKDQELRTGSSFGDVTSDPTPDPTPDPRRIGTSDPELQGSKNGKTDLIENALSAWLPDVVCDSPNCTVVLGDALTSRGKSLCPGCEKRLGLARSA